MLVDFEVLEYLLLLWLLEGVCTGFTDRGDVLALLGDPAHCLIITIYFNLMSQNM